MNIGLVGWGVETKSVFRHFGDAHTYLIVNEEPRDDFPSGKNITVQTHDAPRTPGLTSNVTDLTYLTGLDSCDVIALSPTAKKPFGAAHPDKSDPVWEKVTTATQLFFELCPTQNIIGVTGTKGKGTTTTLIAKLLEAGGKRVHIGGNIGIPVLDLLPDIQKNDWVTLELSSFQLHDFPYSPHIAVHLMMMPEHIAEWHTTFDHYQAAKSNLFAHQKPTDIAIYFANNDHAIENAALSPGTQIPYMKAPGARILEGSIYIDDLGLMHASDVGLLGAHNLENICAALTATWQVHQDVNAITDVLKNFSGLEHRLQLVRNMDGVAYYDDSFGTTPDTAIVAMNSFTQPKVMIVGGHNKGNDYSKMIERLQYSDIRSVIGIGLTGMDIIHKLRKNKKITAALHTKQDYNSWTMSEILQTARQSAKDGDIVLLSTGSASFGLFTDYKDRGDQFIAAAESL